VWDIIEAMRSSFLRQRGGGIREGTVCPCFPKFLACTIFFFFFFFYFWRERFGFASGYKTRRGTRAFGLYLVWFHLATH